MIRTIKPGMPIPILSKPVAVVSEAGDFENQNGIRVILGDGQLVFMAAFDGADIVYGLSIEVILEAIEAYSRKNES